MTAARNYNAAVDLVDRNIAEGRGDKAAFIDPERSLSYANLYADCQRAQNLMASCGLKRESRVAMVVLDTVDFPAIFLGAIRSGIVPVALNTLLSTDQYAYILADCRARVLFVAS